MRRTAALTIIVLIFTALPSSADSKHKQKSSKSAEFDFCSGSSAIAHYECAQRKFEAADKKLNVVYRKLLSQAGENERNVGDETDQHPKSRLVNAQRAWIKFRDTNYEFVGEFSGGAPAWRSAYEIHCRAAMTEERTKEIQEYVDK